MATRAEAGIDASLRGSSRFGWVRLEVLGAILALVAPVFPMLVQGFEPFFLTMMVPVAIGLVIVRFARRTGIVWLGVVNLLLLAMNAAFIPEALAHPEAPADFVTISMLTVGNLLAVIASIPAFREARGRSSVTSKPRAIAGVAIVLVAAAAGTSWVAKGNLVDDAPAASSTPVVLEDFAFGPKEITVQDGKVSLYLTNNDSSRHTFTVDELGIDVSIAPGQSRLVQFDAPAGKYHFYCKPHSPGMEGDLTVA